MVSHYNFGDQLNTTDVNGSTPLHNATKRGDVKMVKILLSYGKLGKNLSFFLNYQHI